MGPTKHESATASLKRLGVSAQGGHYFSLHAVLDVRHSQAWNAEVIELLIESDPAIAPLLAEGALMRLQCGAACFARYRGILWG